MRSSPDPLHQGPLQTWRRHACDQDPCQEKPDKNASHSFQKPEQLQLYPLNRGNFKRKFLRSAIRYHNPKLCKLPGEHPVFREPSTEVEHVVQGPDASQGLHKKDSNLEDQRIIDILQLSHGDLRLREFQYRRNELICYTIFSIEIIRLPLLNAKSCSKFKNIWFWRIMGESVA